MIQVLHGPLFNPLDIFALWPRRRDSNEPTVIYALRKCLISILSKTAEDSNPQICTDIYISERSLHSLRKWHHQLFPVGCKAHKCVQSGSCSGRDFSIMVQPISTWLQLWKWWFKFVIYGCKNHETFLLLDAITGLKWTSSRRSIT